MSNIGLDFGADDAPRPPYENQHENQHEDPAADLPRGGSRRAAPARGRVGGCLPMVLAGVLVVVGLFFGGGWAIDKVKSLVGVSEDYSGKGTTPVTIEVHQGDSSTAIGRTLKAAGVVKSVGAFVDAAQADKRSLSIGVGFYSLKKEMKASVALAALLDKKNLVQTTVTIPEGFRVDQIVAKILAVDGLHKTSAKITKAKLRAALADPSALGLPAEAGGDPEGYLFPDTYVITPGETARALLTAMVERTKQVEKDLGIARKARALGYTVDQVMTVASILEYEARRDEDYPKVARAIYNRLDAGMALQSDATVAFANDLSGTVYTTPAQRAIDSPYNTYKYTGLPPGPIGSPGEKTIEAALNPTPGNWLYWVVVNLETGETRFNSTYAGHQRDVAAFHQYCETSDAC